LQDINLHLLVQDKKKKTFPLNFISILTLQIIIASLCHAILWRKQASIKISV